MPHLGASTASLTVSPDRLPHLSHLGRLSRPWLAGWSAARRVVGGLLARQRQAGVGDPCVSFLELAQRLTRAEAVKLFMQVRGHLR